MLIGSFGRFYWSAPLVGFIGRLDLSLVLLGHARQPGRPNTVVNRDREHEKKKKRFLSEGLIIGNLCRSVADSAKFAWNPTETAAAVLAMIRNALWCSHIMKYSDYS